MRTTIVPAQITSVEDKIAGSLSFSQLLLLITPLFLSVAMYVLLPPFAGFHIYKVAIASVITIICLLMAIRIKGRLIAEWFAIRLRYNARPLHYVFDKNSSYGRQTIKKTAQPKQAEVKEVTERPVFRPLVLQPKEHLAYDAVASNAKADVQFIVNKKGGLRVRIKETN